MVRRLVHIGVLMMVLGALAAVTAIPAAQAERSEQAQEATVYVTASGKRYHRADCRTLRRSKTPKSISLKEAKHKGYTPCGVCRPVSQEAEDAVVPASGTPAARSSVARAIQGTSNPPAAFLCAPEPAGRTPLDSNPPKAVNKCWKFLISRMPERPVFAHWRSGR